MELTMALADMAKDMGATLVGVAPPERFDGAPAAHHPADLLPGARAVMVFGIRILDRVMNWPELLKGSPFYPETKRAEALRLCLYEKSGYQIINDHLNTIALRLATHLEELGHPSLFFPTTNTGVPEEYAHVPAMFSHRHAAVRAGLGEFGLNNVVVTAKYGPRIRWNSVITAAPLIPSPLLATKTCDGLACRECVRQCPGGALRTLPEAEEHRLWLNPAARTEWDTCRSTRLMTDCMGRCLRVCPAGRSPEGGLAGQIP
jgi:epoxyqueuosine reductase QueG